MKIAITGHRPKKIQGKEIAIYNKLQKAIDYYKPTEIISGMALGVDTIWANLALHNNIKLICAIPDGSQADRWSKEDQSIYYRILDRAAEVINVSRKVNFDVSHLHMRNRWMVDNCDLLIAVWNGDEEGGTYSCYYYAVKQKRNTIHINPNLL